MTTPSGERAVVDVPKSLEAYDAFRARDEAADGVAVWAVVVADNGRAFSVVADLDEFAEGPDLLRPGVVYDAASRVEAASSSRWTVTSRL